MNQNEKILIAVASTNRKQVNQHFGHAERFLIYSACDDSIDFVEERKVSKYCLGPGAETYEHPFEAQRFNNIVNTIKDCRFVLVSRIGTIPEKQLLKEGVLTVIAYDFIDDTIRKALTTCA